MENATVLGISIGTRECGIAIVKNGMLIDWKVKNYRGHWSDNKMIRIIHSIEKLIRKYGVRNIACKFPSGIRNLHIDYLVEELKKTISETNVSLIFISLEELKVEQLPKIPNRKTYAEYLASNFPELQPLLHKHNKIKTDYHLKVFEAVGAAYHCLRIEQQNLL